MVSPDRTLDLEAISKTQRDDFLFGVHSLLLTYQEEVGIGDESPERIKPIPYISKPKQKPKLADTAKGHVLDKYNNLKHKYTSLGKYSKQHEYDLMGQVSDLQTELSHAQEQVRLLKREKELSVLISELKPALNQNRIFSLDDSIDLDRSLDLQRDALPKDQIKALTERLNELEQCNTEYASICNNGNDQFLDMNFFQQMMEAPARQHLDINILGR